MDAFAWGVIGSLAGVAGAVAAIAFGLIPLLRDREDGRDRAQVPPVPSDGETGPAAAGESDRTVVVGDIPQEPVAFQPRPELLAALDGCVPGPVVVRAVTGMRGVGKTHLAAEYARARLAERWRLVAWVSAEDPEGLVSGLAEVAAALGVDAAGNREASARAVRHWLETGGDQCLLVLDNAADPAALRPFLPAGGAARVIITSNEQSVTALGAGVAVDVFTESEALAFLAGRTGSADTDGARQLAAELGYLPLALAQAAAVIAGQRLGYGTYLGRLRALPVEELLLAEEAGQYPRGVAAAVLLAAEAVRAGDDSGTAMAVLEMLAVLSAAGVRRTMLHAAGQGGILGGDVCTAQVVDRVLGRLAGASLLTFSVDGSAVTVHRLVMRVIREQATRQHRLGPVCGAAAGVLEYLSVSLRRSWHQDRAAVRDLVEQVTSLDSAATGCYGDGSDLADLLLWLRLWAVLLLYWLRDSTAQAITIAEPLLRDLERVYGPDHPGTLGTLDNLALIYQEAGRTAEAIPLHEQALTGRERLYGPDHPHTLKSRNNLANAYRDSGRTAEAIPLHEQTLTIRERVLGPDHPETLNARTNLACDYQTAGRAAEAILLHEQTLTGRERVLGPDHPDTLTTRNNLAIAYLHAGRAAEAILLLEQSLTDYKRVLGPDHPHTLNARDNLASTYQDAGRTTGTSGPGS